jgi:hypothetical protein
MLIVDYTDTAVVFYVREVCIKIHNRYTYISCMLFVSCRRICINIVELNEFLRQTGLNPGSCSATLVANYVPLDNDNVVMQLWQSAVYGMHETANGLTAETIALLAAIDDSLY